MTEENEQAAKAGKEAAIAQVPPSPTIPANLGQCKYERTPIWEKVLAIIGVSAAVVYAGVSLMM